jgi:hypothetical protein
MNLPDSLKAHTALCEEIYDLMIEENRFLRSSGRAPSNALLARKGALLGTLSFSIERLRAAMAEDSPTTPEIRTRVQDAQQTILKALLLDRENEQLLLKSTLQHRPAAPEIATPSQVNRAYGRVVAS